ncbi:hypothetical protein FORC098_1059 [Salmonella enterica subsp. enterica serovar Typhimurium]|nr:hypothetical protein FORC098_1059 [Salmonella enterica subsp. enterica serovar Typhimurium]
MFPAPAGINRSLISPFAVEWCVPRASGDKPLTGLAVIQLTVCSPRQRG